MLKLQKEFDLIEKSIGNFTDTKPKLITSCIVYCVWSTKALRNTAFKGKSCDCSYFFAVLDVERQQKMADLVWKMTISLKDGGLDNFRIC